LAGQVAAAGSGGGRAVGIAAGAAVLFAAAAVRLWASTGDLWLDEIWSLQIAEALSSPLDALAVRASNSHPLETALLWAIGRTDWLLAYRVPSVLAGVAAVALAGAIGWRRSGAEALAGLVLVASSCLAIHYASEARGYAFVMAFTLACVWTQEHREARRTWLWTLLFAASVALGLLSHVNFVFVYAALFSWSVAAECRAHPRGRAVRAVAAWHGLPLLAVALLWFPYALRLEVGGAPPRALGEGLLEVTGLSLGLPASGPGALLGAALAALALGTGLVLLARERDPRWVLYAFGIVLLPGAWLWLQPPPHLSPRYVLGAVTLFLLLLAELCGRLDRRGRAGRLACAGLLVAFVLGNAFQIAPLLRHGRGSYREALAWMAERSREPVLSVTSNLDFQTRIVFGYYARALPPGRTLRYYEWEERPKGGTEWLIHYETPGVPHGSPFVKDPQGVRYQLERRYPSAPLSGQSYLLYRRVGGAAPERP
jgi:hypothetical protein